MKSNCCEAPVIWPDANGHGKCGACKENCTSFEDLESSIRPVTQRKCHKFRVAFTAGGATGQDKAGKAIALCEGCYWAYRSNKKLSNLTRL